MHCVVEKSRIATARVARVDPPPMSRPAHLVRELTTSQPAAQGQTAARERPDSVGKCRKLGQGEQQQRGGRRRRRTGGSGLAARDVVAKRAGAATLTTQHGGEKTRRRRDRHGICTGTKTVNEGDLQLDSLHLRCNDSVKSATSSSPNFFSRTKILNHLFCPRKVTRTQGRERGNQFDPSSSLHACNSSVCWVTSAVALRDASHNPLERGEVGRESSASD